MRIDPCATLLLLVTRHMRPLAGRGRVTTFVTALCACQPAQSTVCFTPYTLFHICAKKAKFSSCLPFWPLLCEWVGIPVLQRSLSQQLMCLHWEAHVVLPEQHGLAR